MELKVFSAEQWMTEYENEAVYNMTDTSALSLCVQDLLENSNVDLNSVVLDYGAICGSDELKKEIAKLYENQDLDTITLCNGALEANEHVIYTLLDSTDHAIAFTPGYQQFYDLPKSIHAEVSLIEYEEEKGWKFDFGKLEKAVKDNTKMILINNPSNPTGSYLNNEELQKLVEIAEKYDLWILCDEVYHSGSIPALKSIADLYAKGISTGSLSKAYALAGLRFGWIKADKNVIEQINYRRDYSFISTGPIKDLLALQALKNKEKILKRNERIIAENKAILQNWLQENPHYSMVVPKYGLVGFLKYDFDIPSKNLALQLLKDKGLFFVPGICFDAENHLRIGFGRDPENFKKGLSLLSEWTNQLL